LDASSEEPRDGETAARERLAMFEDSVARLRRGEWNVEAFAEWLEEIALQMAERQQQLQQIYLSLPPELEEVFLEEVEIGFRGIGLYQTGIQSMREFVRTREDDLLDRALESMRAGNGLILEAMRINRTNREAEEVDSSPLDEVEEEVL
jgi:hypothetical protein